MQITTSTLANYAYGLLSPGIAHKVKEALLTDELLRWQYEGILQLMKDHPDEDPEELLEKMSANVIGRVRSIRKTESVRALPNRWLLMAAILIGIIAIGAFFIYRNLQSPSRLAEEIIQENAISPYENETRGRLQIADTAKWKTAFINNDFRAVVSGLEKKENRTPEEQFFLAVSYIKKSPPQLEAAEALFSNLTKANHEYSDDAWLYLGLAQTLLNRKEEAIASLQHVEQTTQVKELEDCLRK